MRIQMALKISTAILAHRLNSHGYHTYWQEVGINFLTSVCFPPLSPWLENENQYNPTEGLLLYVMHIIKTISY